MIISYKTVTFQNNSDLNISDIVYPLSAFWNMKRRNLNKKY